MRETPVLQRLNLRIDPDDRIALLGRNGNGKTTLARLLAAQLPPMDGGDHRLGQDAGRLFHPISGRGTARRRHAAPAHDPGDGGQHAGAVRAQLGRFGFSGDKATTLVGKLSGGERARLALALITRDAPHLLILDEPTNHLDVDAREALVQALNGYDGAVILVSHDRHMIELTADRLVLVENGDATEYAGSVDDYIDFVLGRSRPSRRSRNSNATTARLRRKRAKMHVRSRKLLRKPKRRARAWRRNAPHSIVRCSIRQTHRRSSRTLPMSELSKRRAQLASDLASRGGTLAGSE